VSVPAETDHEWAVYSRLYRGGAGNNVSLRCLGNIPGPRYLDGRTANGTVGLAPNLSPKFTGTEWRVVRAGDGVVELKCLGDIEGPRWQNGGRHGGSRRYDRTPVYRHQMGSGTYRLAKPIGDSPKQSAGCKRYLSFASPQNPSLLQLLF